MNKTYINTGNNHNSVITICLSIYSDSCLATLCRLIMVDTSSLLPLNIHFYLGPMCPVNKKKFSTRKKILKNGSFFRTFLLSNLYWLVTYVTKTLKSATSINHFNIHYSLFGTFAKVLLRHNFVVGTKTNSFVNQLTRIYSLMMHTQSNISLLSTCL